MNPIIKQEWIKRIMDQINIPAMDRLSAEYLLNKMYVEFTGKPIRYLNVNKCADETGKIPLHINFGLKDPITKEVQLWAGLKDRDPKLPSYTKIGGVGLGENYLNLSGVQALGVIVTVTEKREGIGKVITKEVKRKIPLSGIVELIKMDC